MDWEVWSGRPDAELPAASGEFDTRGEFCVVSCDLAESSRNGVDLDRPSDAAGR